MCSDPGLLFPTLKGFPVCLEREIYKKMATGPFDEGHIQTLFIHLTAIFQVGLLGYWEITVVNKQQLVYIKKHIYLEEQKAR